MTDNQLTTDDHGMTSEERIVTPELAESLLERNVMNRPIDKGVVNFMAASMARGEWKITHQGVALDGDFDSGRLLDGQHRLHAVIKSGVPVRMLVFLHVLPETFSVLDTGKKRTAGDVLNLSGEKDATLLGSTIRHVLLFNESPDASWGGAQSRVTNEQIINEFKRSPSEYRDAVSVGRVLSSDVGMIATAATTAYYVTMQAAPSVDETEWIEGLRYGANLSIGDPRLAVLNVFRRLNSGSTARRRTDTRGHMGLYIKGWNAWVKSREVRSLRFQQKEKFPNPVRVS